MWKDFKEFVMRGNVLGLAIAVVLGAAFGTVIASFANDILMQLIAAAGAQPDFSALSYEVNDTPIRYGNFLTALLSFLIVALAMFFVVKVASRFEKKKEVQAPKESEIDLLKQIRDELRLRTPLHS